MTREGTEKLRRKARKPRTRDVSYRKKHLDPYLDLARKMKTRSFIPILARVLWKLGKNQYRSGKWLAEKCRWVWSRASVWSHLRWLTDRGILRPAYDGRKMFFGWNHKRSSEAARLLKILLAECRRYRARWNRANRKRKGRRYPPGVNAT